MEEQEIRKTIDTYLLAVKKGKLELFQKAFYSDAVVINAGENDPKKATKPIAAFANMIKESIEAGTYIEEIPRGITISHVGRVANVRLDFELKFGDSTTWGTDYFNLVKRNELWRISQKIYDVICTK